MPRGDRTGPTGMGPMTGRAAGYCAGYGVPGYASPGYGRGYGGWGRGRGFYGGGRGGRFRGGPGYGWYGAPHGGRYVDPGYLPYGAPEISPEQEITLLRNQSKQVQQELSSINDRIRELEDIAEKDK